MWAGVTLPRRPSWTAARALWCSHQRQDAGAACTTLAAMGGDPARSALMVMVAAMLISKAAFEGAIRADKGVVDKG